MRGGIFLSLILATCLTAEANAACVSPVSSPQTADKSEWIDMLSLDADRALNSKITLVQDIATTGTGDVNLDFNSITFDSNGKTAAQWMADFRDDIDSYIYKGTTYSVAPYDDENKRRWESSIPVGAIMVFDLSKLVIPFERGAVVVSCHDPETFVFSTISISGLTNPGDHPVSGNRGFGIKDNQDGSVTFFTKAADRLKGDNAVFQAIGSKKTFELGAKVWEGLLNNIEKKTSSLNPREKINYRRTEIY